MSDKTLTSQWAADKRLEEISYGHQSHDWMASKVRMLMRNDLDHELVCTGARDRIVWLAARVAELEAALSARASAGEGGELANLYAAASKGFHVMETCGPDRKYWHVSQFRSMADLHAFDDAWLAAMISVRDAAPQPAQAGASGGGVPGALIQWERDYDDQHLTPYRRDDVKRILADWRASITTPASPATGEEDSPQDISWWVRRLKVQEAITDKYVARVAELESSQPAAAQGGEWVMVPRKLTTAMWKAWEQSNQVSGSYQEDYDAMLAAAPHQPESAMGWWEWITNGDGEGVDIAAVIRSMRTVLKETDGDDAPAWCVEAWIADLQKITTRPTPEAQAREYRLFDSQWVNVVNHAGCYRDMNKEDAVAQAVKLTEQAMAANINDCKWPRPRKADAALALPAQGEGNDG